MISCPKCRSIRINGPKYRKSGFGREALLYTCMQCGYEDEEACADADMKSSGRPPPDGPSHSLAKDDGSAA